MELKVPGNIYNQYLYPKPRGKKWPKPDIRKRGRGIQAVYEVPRKEAIQILLHVKSKGPDAVARSWIKEQTKALRSEPKPKAKFKKPVTKKESPAPAPPSKKSRASKKKDKGATYKCPVCHQQVTIHVALDVAPRCNSTNHLKRGHNMVLVTNGE